MKKSQTNRRMLARLSILAVLMFGFGFAMVPFYKAFCEATGINDFIKPASAVRNTQVDTSRLITLELDANVHGMPWEFRPVERSVRFHPGEMIQVMYEVRNTGSTPIVGQALPSYAPRLVSQHVNKLECFCFRQQALGPGEARQMPVQLVIDPALPKDVHTITLSYTFFEVNGAVGLSEKDEAG